MSVVKRIVQASSFAIGLILLIVTAISLSQRNYGAAIVATILASPFFWISRSLFRQGEFINKKKKIVTLVVDQDGVIQDSDYKMYLKTGVKKYQVLATLDLETCPYCQKMDLRVFPLNEYNVGSTAPPFHDGCRCCTVPYIDEEELAEIEDDEPYPWGTRAARDPETGKTVQVPGNMTYKEWKCSLDRKIQANRHLPEEVYDLIWFADGPLKNYFIENRTASSYQVFGFDIETIASYLEEPSLIYCDAPISKISRECERPPYYPSYNAITPEQRLKYWEFLIDPFTGKHDIGYVFIFYYGLERHLLEGKYDKAFDMILKLRDIYTNKSFQWYSSRALIFSTMLHKRKDRLSLFLKSIDKEFELEIDAHLYLLIKASLNDPLSPYEVMRFSKALGLENQYYIKKNPDIFMEVLSENIAKIFQSGMISIADIIIDSPIKESQFTEERIFANTSLVGESVYLPNLLKNKEVNHFFSQLLNQTHEDVKERLKSMRNTKK